jgi:UDP:flavonoid glycosyltransferase YjiC (YdhE family)
MQLTLLAIGTRGDVQPMLALGCELVTAGHEVRILTHPRYEQLTALAGLPFAPLSQGPVASGQATLAGTEWERLRSHGPGTLAAFAQDARAVVRKRLLEVTASSERSDAIIASMLATILGWQAADHLGVPLIRVAIDEPPPLADSQTPLLRAARTAIWPMPRAWLNSARADVGLGKLRGAEPLAQLERRRVLFLRAYSPAVGATPAATRDWVKATGFWRLGRSIDPPPTPELASFVEAGSPPVCIDFGSMAKDDPARMIRLAVDTLRPLGRRGVLIHRAFGPHLGELPENIFGVAAVPHDWLLPRCAAVVHHCGSGTVAAALHAGVPTVPVPHVGAQFRWAQRLHELGVASSPIPQYRLRAENLCARLIEVTADSRMRTRATALQRLVAGETGTTTAARLIATYLTPGRTYRAGAETGSAPLECEA